MDVKTLDQIVVLSHKLKEVEIVSFDWVSGYGWTYNWYENERERSLGCLTYGLFPSDFVEVIGNNQNKIEALLKTKSKEVEIHASEILEGLNIT